jgi:phenylpyruvate tautomerase PptA (4-oxalocrotonate tautomerase family)
MPMIDVYIPDNLFSASADRQLGEQLALAVLRAEGVTAPGPMHMNNTAVYIHRLPASAVQTAASAQAKTARIQVITPPQALSRDGQKQVTEEMTAILASVCGDSSQALRTWVILTEAAEGGWGIAGTAFGKVEFVALAAKVAAT